MKILIIFIVLFASNLEARTERSIHVSIPIFSQKLEISMNPDWKPVFQNAQTNAFIIEFAPNGQRLDDWTELLVIEGARNAPSTSNAQQAYEGEVAIIKKACPEKFVNIPVKNLNTQGYDAMSGVIGCRESPQIAGKNEVAFYTFIKGKNDFYKIKKAYREKLDKSKAPRLNGYTYKELAGEVLSVRLCQNNGQSPVCVPENATPESTATAAEVWQVPVLSLKGFQDSASLDKAFKAQIFTNKNPGTRAKLGPLSAEIPVGWSVFPTFAAEELEAPCDRMVRCFSMGNGNEPLPSVKIFIGEKPDGAVDAKKFEARILELKGSARTMNRVHHLANRDWLEVSAHDEKTSTIALQTQVGTRAYVVVGSILSSHAEIGRKAVEFIANSVRWQ